MLTEKIKQITEEMLDKHATVQSIAEHIGPWKIDGYLQCELMPRDPDFRDGSIVIDRDHGVPNLPAGERRIDSLGLTLAKDVVLTPDAMERIFGKWRTFPPPPEGNPYSVTFYYPNNRAPVRVTISAELTGPPEGAKARVTSLNFRRDDFEELMRQQ